MKAKRWILVTTALALPVALAVVFHLQSADHNPRHAAPKPSLPAHPIPAPVAAEPPALPGTESPATMAEIDALAGKIEFAPINVRPHHTRQSTDFIVALKDHGYLGLSHEQMEKLLTAYLEIGIERSIHEGSIATARVIGPDESLITIPPYPAEGARLQAELYRKFAAILGAERGAEVQAALSATLYARNYGFGDTEQQVQIKRLPGLPPTYSFVHRTGTLRVPYKDGYLTVQYGGMANTHTLDDLNSYLGLIDLLPGGGS